MEDNEIVRWEKNGKFFYFYGGRMLMHKLGKQGEVVVAIGEGSSYNEKKGV